MNHDECYNVLETTADLYSFLIKGAEIKCFSAEEWDLALDLSEQAGFIVGFDRDEFRPGNHSYLPTQEMNIYYADDIAEVHTKWDPDTGIPFDEIYQRFFGGYNERIEVDETCELFA